MDEMTYVFIAILLMNLIGFVIMGNDKSRAIHHKYRIPEKTLWLIALFGGAIGTTIGMQVYRHKTKHLSFKVGFPLLTIIDIVLYIYLLVQ